METTVIPPGTVVVGLDGSPSSEQALDWAIGYAGREGLPLTLAHGLDPAGSVWMEPEGADHRAVLGALHDDAMALLARSRDRVAEVAPDQVVHQALWMSDARVTLLDLAERAAAVIVGSRGRGPVSTLLLGSVGVAVSRHAPCPVVVIRPGNPGLVRHGVLVGADASERSRPVLEFAYRQASLCDLPLTVVHSGREDRAGVELGEAVAGLGEKFPEVRATTRLVPDNAADVLARESRRMDLVVVGAHHRNIASTILHGSVTDAVVEHAECPVAVVPLAGNR
mgnify:CR=1 FL=1